MEGHVSNRYARYITSSPFAFSKEGLENKLKLLVIKANKETITYEEFLNLKYNTNEDLELVNHMKEITEIKVDIKNILKDHTDKTSFYLNAIKPRFDNDFNNIIFKQITSIKNSISIHKQLK